MTNWMTTIPGIAAILIGLAVQFNWFTPAQGVSILAAATGIIGILAKQFNVTGGSIPQASPPGVALKSDALGMVAAVDAIQKKEGVITIAESSARIEAQEVVDTPPSVAIVDILKKEGRP